MLSNIEMNDFSSGMINNEKYIKRLETNGWDGKKVHAHPVLTIVFEKTAVR
jgi:hypothetical protein